MNQLDKSLFECQFNKEMIMSAVVEGNDIVVRGCFRSLGDLGGLIYHSADLWSHPSCRHRFEPNFSGITIEYDYVQTGPVKNMDEVEGHGLTIWSGVGVHYINLEHYRTSGSVTNGHIRLDFDDLWGGFAPYTSALSPDGEYYEAPSPEWHKVHPETITKLLWTFPYQNIKKFSKYPIGGSQQFTVRFNNFTVTGARDIGGENLLDTHSFRLASGYDNNYDQNPERFVKHFYRLGFREWIDFYIGASHYYDKQARTDAGGNFIKIPGTRDASLLEYDWLGEDDIWDYEYEQITSTPLNHATEAWFSRFFSAAHAYSYTVVGSISMESVDWPTDWRQLDSDGNEGHSGWDPPTKFCSFCNSDARNFYKDLFMKIADLQDAAGLDVVVQLGEPWWWSNAFIREDKQGGPCFYDQATKDKFQTENGYPLPEYDDIWETNYDETAINWLRDEIGKFTHEMRDHVKATYSSAKFCVLFFPPTVIDPNRVGEMMRTANFPKSYWQNPNLDILQIEDYDWIIDDDPQHEDVYDFPYDELGYTADKTHYFAGFVLNPDPWTGSDLWERIDQAAADGLDRNFQTFIWAATQIKRDGWKPHRTTQQEIRPFNLYDTITGVTMTLCTLWNLETRDGFVIRGTDWDKPITVTGLGTFDPSADFSRTAIAFNAGGGIDNVELHGALTSDLITEEDLLSGRYDFAVLDIYFVDPDDPDNTYTHVLRSRIAQVRSMKGKFEAQVEGLVMVLSQGVPWMVSPTCVATFGDNRCGIDTSVHTLTGKVTSVTSNSEFVVDNSNIDSQFNYGLLTFTSGDNDGLSYEVEKVTSGPTVKLFIAASKQVQVDDTFSIVKGCDKSLSRCKQYDNVANFRGYPHLPGNDKVLVRGGL